MEEVGEDDEIESIAENEVREGEISNLVENDGEMMPIDRLSALPDCLLIRILTRLHMKKAVITGVLSRRWRYLWTDMPCLIFREISSETEKIHRFVFWVHRTLVLRSSGDNLDELGIEFEYDKWFAPDVNVWVEFAVRNKVKRLNLQLYSSRDFYVLPQVMYSCSSVTRLWMQRCIVSPQRTIEWQSLTNLNINDMELHEHVIQKILSGCPVLSSLSLTGCWGFDCLDIDSQSLHHLSLQDDEVEVDGPLLEISAPYLRSLYISLFPINRRKLRLRNVPSLNSADIRFNFFGSDASVEEMNTMELFEDIKHVKELNLESFCLQILSKLVRNGWQLPISTRECLRVEAYRDEHCISGIVGLLESSPKLETLVIECEEERLSSWGPVARDDLACDLLHLKTVELTNYADPRFSGQPMLTMARILLKRATALEKMVVNYIGDVTEFSSFIIEIAQELLSYPRSSQKAVVALHP